MLPTEERDAGSTRDALELSRRALYSPDAGPAELARYREAVRAAERAVERADELAAARTSGALPDGRTAGGRAADEHEPDAHGPDALGFPLAVGAAALGTRGSTAAARRRVALLVSAGAVVVAVVAGVGTMLIRVPADPLARPTLAPRDSVLSDAPGDIAAAHDFVRNSVDAPAGSEPVDFFAQRGLTRPGTGGRVSQIAATERHLSASGRVGLGLLAPVARSEGSVVVLCDRPARFSWRIDTGSTSSAAPSHGPAQTAVIRGSGSCGDDLVAATFDVTGGTLLSAMSLTLSPGAHAVIEVAVAG